MSVIIAPGIPSMVPGVYNTASDAYAAAAAQLPGPTNSNPIYYGSGNSAGTQANAIASQLATTDYGAQLAQMLAGVKSSDNSDYGDYLRKALELSANNTAQSQAFAREQMNYQKQSDATAMSWSAQEAAKNRLWQETLSNTAHQREMKDLIAAGLNPILAANNGAYTGSGATGQAFSSSGASGQVDTTAAGAMAGMAQSIVNTASQAAIAQMYNETTRYQADMQYAASKMASETSIYNENSRNEANKIITAMNNQSDIAKANINAQATTSAAGASAAAMRYSADKNYAGSLAMAEANKYGSDTHLEGTKYSSDSSKAASKYSSDNSTYASIYGTEYSGYKGLTQHALDDLRYASQQAGNGTARVLDSVGQAYDWINDKSDQIMSHVFPGSAYKAGGSGRKF